MKTINFISGLPRSGSTLLGALLAQNSSFHGSMSSPVANLFCSMQVQMSPQNSFHVFFDENKRRNLLRGIFESYYADTQADFIFDTNRIWCAKLAALADIFPEAKVICCVRPPIWIIDSFERILQKNPLIASRMFAFKANTNVFNRLEIMMGPDGVIGGPYGALQEAFYGNLADRLVLVSYESLAHRPKETMAALYDFLGIAPFSHDFDNVEFRQDDFDEHLGVAGLHTVRPVVSYKERECILPPEVIRMHENREFWRDPARNPRNVLVI